jgi:hypothetical protein
MRCAECLARVPNFRVRRRNFLVPLSQRTAVKKGATVFAVLRVDAHFGVPLNLATCPGRSCKNVSGLDERSFDMSPVCSRGIRNA